ncbi:DNA polymerase III subunit beta [Clostridium paraputrificum]|uniref:DNA polymerase III subunit beta n=1 Tax=Clostridium paraputrificum TaxID=29363 RepID=UPI00189B17E9|nr:DNA polymerase III subunit beta [Clostridium paraputrificum]MDB2125249.1 DNA polymerase III subunit beta [Clostridium paraputrificum]
MKAIVNSESLIYLNKLLNVDRYQVNVQKDGIKLSATKELKDAFYQVILTENTFGNEEEGKILIPKEAIKLLPKKEPCLVSDYYISTQNQKISFNEDEEFKELIEFNKPKECKCIPNFDFLMECKYALEKDNVRPQLGSICIDKNNFVAMDGYRMGIRSIEDIITENEILIPEEVVNILKKIKGTSIATIQENNEFVKICFGRITIVYKKSGLKYVDWRALIRDVKKSIKITLNVDDIKFVLSQYIKLYRGYGSIVIFNINNKRSYIESSKAVIGITKFERYISAELEGEEIEFGINAQYLLDALKYHDSNFTLYMSSPVSPIILESKNKTDMILPIRLLK